MFSPFLYDIILCQKWIFSWKSWLAVALREQGFGSPRLQVGTQNKPQPKISGLLEVWSNDWYLFY